MLLVSLIVPHNERSNIGGIFTGIIREPRSQVIGILYFELTGVACSLKLKLEQGVASTA